VRLRLNPAGRTPASTGGNRHKKNRGIHGDLDALASAGTAHGKIAEVLERHISELLKGEWAVSKDEAVKGKLKTIYAVAVRRSEVRRIHVRQCEGYRRRRVVSVGGVDRRPNF